MRSRSSTTISPMPVQISGMLPGNRFLWEDINCCTNVVAGGGIKQGIEIDHAGTADQYDDRAFSHCRKVARSNCALVFRRRRRQDEQHLRAYEQVVEADRIDLHTAQHV